MRVFLIASFILLAGCASKITLVPQDGLGPIGRGEAPMSIGNSGRLTIDLDGKTYEGEWTFMSGGGFIGSSFGTGTANAYGGGSYASSNMSTQSTSVLQSTSGSGQAWAQTPDGEILRCRFDYNTFSSTGLGVCVDETDRVYDLTIR